MKVLCRSGCRAKGHAVQVLASARGKAHGAVRVSLPGKVRVKRGATLEVRITASGMTGRYRVYRVGASGLKAAGSGCLSPAGDHTSCAG